jgi:hypothetical protein
VSDEIAVAWLAKLRIVRKVGTTSDLQGVITGWARSTCRTRRGVIQ